MYFRRYLYLLLFSSVPSNGFFYVPCSGNRMLIMCKILNTMPMSGSVAFLNFFGFSREFLTTWFFIEHESYRHCWNKDNKMTSIYLWPAYHSSSKLYKRAMQLLNIESQFTVKGSLHASIICKFKNCKIQWENVHIQHRLAFLRHTNN